MVGEGLVAHQWHIYLAELDPVRGSEQAGRRPVLVVSRERLNQILPVVNVVPLTSLKLAAAKIFHNEVLLPAGAGGLAKDSIALCYQIRTLDKSRLVTHLGKLNDERLQSQISQALRFQLDI
jgi:mRNA interferase MazF